MTVTTIGPLADIEGELSRAWIAAGAALMGHMRHTDARFDAVDRRFDDVDRRFDQVDARFDRVETRLGQVETDLKALQGQVNRLEISTNEGFANLGGRIEYLVGLIIRAETKGQEPPAATDD